MDMKMPAQDKPKIEIGSKNDRDVVWSQFGDLPCHLGYLPRHAAQRWGKKTALICEDKSLSFAAVEEHVARLSGGMARLGIRAGDRVVLYLPNGWQWIITYYAILRLGAAVVPANILLSSEEVGFLASNSGACGVIMKSTQAADVRSCLPVDVVTIVVGLADQFAQSFDDLLNAQPLTAVSQVTPEQLATIGYTSGTTGQPKGARLSHKAILLNVAMTSTMHMRTAQDVICSALPCPHVYGNVVMNSAFLTGATLVLHARFDPAAALASIEQHRVTLFEGVPTMYFYLLAAPELSRHDLSSLTRLTVGGQTMPVAQMSAAEAAFGAPLIELWGMTEIAGLGTTHPSLGPRKLGSIGRALPFSQTRIADLANATSTVAAGAVGELMVRGATMMQGYHENPTATAEAIDETGWLATGDIAVEDEDGFITIVDRKKEMILTAGYNVYPSELERVIAQHSAVAMVAVAGIPDTAKGEIAKAFIVLKPDARTNDFSGLTLEIEALCRRQLAAYKIPRAIQFVDDLPKTSTGKILRRNLKNL
jgi:long-chain acyl-CoA synthetase